MVTLKHDSHEHELNLIEVDAYMVGKGKCGVCEMQINEASSIYKCLTEDCPNNSLSLFFFLHKSCAELPKQITHPHHPQHSLVLGREYNQEIVKLTRGSLPHLTACKLCSHVKPASTSRSTSIARCYTQNPLLTASTRTQSLCYILQYITRALNTARSASFKSIQKLGCIGVATATNVSILIAFGHGII
ncbi:hypothetical protein ACET3Z_012804 [Daucus carota]